MPVRWAIANGNFSTGSTWNDGATLGIPTGSDDLFTNTFTVNIDQSFNAITLNNTARARQTVTPLMTSNTTPSPYVAYASNTRGFGFEPYLAFDQSTTRWLTADGFSTGWVAIDLGAGNQTAVNDYTVIGQNAQSNNPRNWTLEGSNDNVSWTVLHTVTLAAALTPFQVYNVTSIGNSTAYRYYRLNITLNGGDVNLGISELQLWVSGSSPISAGGSFNFNSGSISGSATSTSPLSAGATNLITVTATTGSVSLALGGAVTGLSVGSTQIINHTGNCNLTLSGSNFIAGAASIASCINKTSFGTININGNVLGSTGGSSNTAALLSTAGNTIVTGNVVGCLTSANSNNFGINQTVGNLTVIGNVIGGQSQAVSNQGITFSGTSLTVIGSVIGGSGGLASAAISTTSPTTVIGNVSGSATANGIFTTAPVIVTGSVVAQGAVAAISAAANVVFINVSGSVIASSTSNAIIATNASAVVNLAGNIVNVNGKQAIYCQNLFLDNTATTQARFFTFGGSDRTLYSSDTFPNLPSTSNVRFGTTYGPGSGNTGTLRMASPQDVRSGVLTDNTTGSAILSMESLSNEIQTSSDPFAQRLRNISTVDTIGYLLTAFKK